MNILAAGSSLNFTSPSRLSLLLALLVVNVGCAFSLTRQRAGVIEHLEKLENRAKLIEWVNVNIRSKTWNLDALDLGNDASPGHGAARVIFDWDLVHMRPHPGQEVRLIVEADGKIGAVYLGNPRLGVIVKIGDEFGVDKKYLYVIDQSVAVYSSN